MTNNQHGDAVTFLLKGFESHLFACVIVKWCCKRDSLNAAYANCHTGNERTEKYVEIIQAAVFIISHECAVPLAALLPQFILCLVQLPVQIPFGLKNRKRRGDR